MSSDGSSAATPGPFPPVSSSPVTDCSASPPEDGRVLDWAPTPEDDLLRVELDPSRSETTLGLALGVDGQKIAPPETSFPERRYVCDVCSKSFAKASALEEHRKNHESPPVARENLEHKMARWMAEI